MSTSLSQELKTEHCIMDTDYANMRQLSANQNASQLTLPSTGSCGRLEKDAMERPGNKISRAFACNTTRRQTSVNV